MSWRLEGRAGNLWEEKTSRDFSPGQAVLAEHAEKDNFSLAIPGLLGFAAIEKRRAATWQTVLVRLNRPGKPSFPLTLFLFINIIAIGLYVHCFHAYNGVACLGHFFYMCFQ
jgi:hypothetical protein